MPQFGAVLVTTSTESEAQHIARALVTEKLAACVTVFPMRSVYRWQDELCDEAEYQLLIKTDLDRFDQLAERVTALHSYDVPEIIALPITHGSPAYLNWLAQLVGP